MAAIINSVLIQSPGYNRGSVLERRQKCEIVVDLSGYNGLINTHGYTGDNARGANAGMFIYSTE